MVTKLVETWGKLIKTGAKHAPSVEIERRIILFNQINLVVGIIVCSVLSVELVLYHLNGEGFVYSIQRTLIVLSLCALHHLLNAFNLNRISISLLLFDFIFFLCLILPVYVNDSADLYFWISFLPSCSSVAAHFLLPRKKDRFQLFTTLFVYYLLSISVIFYLDWVNGSPTLSPVILENGHYIILAISALFVFINLSFFYIVQLAKNYEDKLSKANQSLELQNQSLCELNTTKNKLFRIIGHDLKSPLINVIHFAEIVERNFDKLEKNQLKELANRLGNSSRNGINLLENLLEWAHAQTGSISFNPCQIGLKCIVDEVIELKSENLEQKNLRIKTSFDSEERVYGDKNMLLTIFRNLIANAIKFSYNSGVITISTEKSPGGTIITVSDTGIGMKEDYAKRLFKNSTIESEPGTNNEVGTGIGLTICKEFVTRHGGNMWVYSKLKEGSQFRFTLPWPVQNPENEKAPKKGLSN